MVANTYAILFTSSNQDRIDFSGAALGNSIRNLDTFTIEAWIKVGSNATSPAQRLYMERQGTGRLPRLAIAAWNDTQRGIGKLRFEFARVDGTSDTNYTYTRPTVWDDYWHHVAFTVDIGNANFVIYLDGANVVTGKLTDGGKDANNVPLKVSDTAPLSLTVGAGYDGTTYTYWDGKIDNIRLWKSALAQSTIQSAMRDHIANPANETNLIEEWRFNEGTGSTTAGTKNTTWTGTLRRAGTASNALWTIDRPFLGDNAIDEQPPTTPTPNAPTGITTNSFTVSWGQSTDNVYVQFYELTVATDSAFNTPVSGYANRNVGRATTVTVTGLNPATIYYWRVRALDAQLNASAWATYNNNAPVQTNALGDVTPPTAPVASAATVVTANSFRANWQAATDNVGVTGYKLDVAYDTEFTRFVDGWRNRDVGNVLTFTVATNIAPSQTYYYRVRAYDAAKNESGDSNVITVTTADPPDTTPPDVVILQPATSIGSRSFTANWNIGTDNVGVVGYYLDVALDQNFTLFVTGFQNRAVGNVTSVAVTGLQPQTGYYYRVRAVDAAGNVSANTTTPEFVQTRIATIEESGLIPITLDPNADTYIREASPSATGGSATSLTVDGTTGARQIAYLRFDLQG
ncbi:MAG: hypothetical protein C4321_04515, partial [Chloroflexota bacterium]